MSTSRQCRLCLGWVSILIFSLGCAHHRGPSTPSTASRQATPAEIVELKKAYAAYVRPTTESHEEFSTRPWTVDELREAAQKAVHPGIQRYAIRRLTFHPDATTQGVLSKLVTTADLVERFYAACALAFQGHKDGLDLLQEIVADRQTLSASGYEVSEAGMVLAILGYELPPSFVGRANPFFSILDRLFE